MPGTFAEIDRPGVDPLGGHPPVEEAMAHGEAPAKVIGVVAPPVKPETLQFPTGAGFQAPPIFEIQRTT